MLRRPPRFTRTDTLCPTRRSSDLSTVKVHGETTSDSAVFTASDPPAPRDPYAVSKWEGEQAVHAATGAMTAVVLRPPLVYGPDVKGNFLALMRWLDRGRPPPLARTEPPRRHRKTIVWGKGV